MKIPTKKREPYKYRDCATARSRTVLFVEGVPATTKLLFKRACYKNRLPMKRVLIDLMQKYAKKHSV